MTRMVESKAIGLTTEPISNHNTILFRTCTTVQKYRHRPSPSRSRRALCPIPLLTGHPHPRGALKSRSASAPASAARHTSTNANALMKSPYQNQKFIADVMIAHNVARCIFAAISTLSQNLPDHYESDPLLRKGRPEQPRDVSGCAGARSTGGISRKKRCVYIEWYGIGLDECLCVCRRELRVPLFMNRGTHGEACACVWLRWRRGWGFVWLIVEFGLLFH
ncbi:hypothetical protein FB567DRAFT_26627 [Paraphoma chrysanthemicola]|uniref:Uncharacterized protein n=1 Tax=Paraphoma chrysanthemicola TaxID=798071 RepID=A0A8K0W447_9PLEO|nr:hypothetical protein FB567DRAFT_26627 [Paraphoma chrysanthemicola]